MLCPWQVFLKARNNKNKSFDVTDVNNNATGTFKYTDQNGLKKLSKINEKGNQMSPKTTDQDPQAKHITSLSNIPRCPMYQRVKNWEDGGVFQDTLHNSAVKSLSCKSKVCQGSMMFSKELTRGVRDKPTPPEELLPQAIQFVNKYYKSFKEPKVEEHLARVEAVTKEIEDTGTYKLTYSELTFAAKEAWRNAPRCIGRIQWSNLQVFDARDCRTTKEMFEHILTHIRYATNGGNLRSAITVFPQRTDGKHDFRLWNSQLIRYAGYQMEDGTILGDPANVELTELCICLGWKPKYGRFDVLPLILQANGQDPDMFEIPPELVLEVEMEHPTYDWFKDMGLKWYALPAVANMLLEVGGLEFPACPFNGWYMSTEIGVRDFCDVQRYNMLEKVAKRMGLETNKVSSLWKDKAVVEINVAVLYSFQKQNVTIMDHHSAAESFMKHIENEFRLRGGCPSDWVWIVPPMSGSITPVFHLEMLNYVLTPFYYYQIEPWKTHVWHDETKKPLKRKIKLAVAAKTVFFASSLMRKIMAARVKVTILYATETGRSETFAKKLATMFNCAFNAKVYCMADYTFSNFDEETLLLVVASTFGNGDSPGNGEKFKKHLFSKKELKNKFRYSVFGLGSRMYPDFCGFAHDIDRKFAQLGAVQIAPTGEGDELAGQEESFKAWAITAFKMACKIFGISGKLNIQLPSSEYNSDVWDPAKHRIVSDVHPMDMIKALSHVHSKTIIPMQLKSRQNLQSPDSSRSTILIKMSCPDVTELQYSPGDHAAVCPGNQAELVNRLIKHLQDAPPCNKCIQLETSTDNGHWLENKNIPACTLTQALTYFVDITTPPTMQLLKKLSQLATDTTEKKTLEELSQNAKDYNEWKSFNSPTILEVLEEFPSIQMPTTFLLTQLPQLKPRYYSISSSPDRTPGEIHLTVAVVNYRTQDGKGPLHHGVCSTWLNSIKNNEIVHCFVRSAKGFHLPKDSAKPCILIGPGTGIAPFRSFWEQRLFEMEHKGVNASGFLLLFGCRQSNVDHIYKEETQLMKKKGIMKEIYTAYSREPNMQKTYVQDILRNQLASEVHTILHQNEGHIYICGDVRMAKDVADTLKGIVAKKLGLNMEQADEYLMQLKIQKRYHEDIFGAVYHK
ncbi:nitric oxide synthase, inducible [Protopterus annectens]|uniref:nitric oxide synthase, inducible n=1 Tax=Protopterus annectens TaxID=7888 RepID=UPI001CF9FC74|nr:nitric oxide synthase, inducible [Protopterus annectens]